MSREDFQARVGRALDLYDSLKPADGAEGMLAAQMVDAHVAAFDCLRRAALADQTFAGRDMALKHVQKLMALYAKQLETLNKHHGKGQQRVTVEHVNVAPGAQAIVGNVESGPVAELCRSHLRIFNTISLAPVGHCFDINAKLPVQLRVRSLRSLYERSDCVRGRCAAVEYLSHKLSFC